jgi:hypothetical protein
MIVKVGDIARMNDGRMIKVTDAVDQTAPEVIANPDDLFLGHLLRYSAVSNKYFYYYNDKLIVNPMSEVVAIETDIVVE